MSKRSRSEADNAEAEAAYVPSLVDHCYSTLTSGRCEWQQLDSLPQSMLSSLLKRCAEERDALRQTCEQQREQLERLQKDRYYVDPPYCCARLNKLDLGPYPSEGSEEEQERYHAAGKANKAALHSHVQGITSKWLTEPPQHVPAPAPSSHNPNYPAFLSYCLPDRRFELIGGFIGAYFDTRRCDPNRHLFRVISSALLLYRLCCLFEVDVSTSETDRYKCVWTVSLWHAASGRQVVFDEHKAAAFVNLDWPAEEDKQLSNDFLELMNLLCGDCPHTYDGTRAGCVA